MRDHEYARGATSLTNMHMVLPTHKHKQAGTSALYPKGRTPEIVAMERKFDEKLGPHVRSLNSCAHYGAQCTWC